jgi:aspartyl-tRNA(Asn)/glutamyl-tRNA(Gln) amidotransferase subunit A
MAAKVGFFSLGTDTGGSVRLPASFTGIYGFKPTYGRNSRYGIGVMSSSFDTPGFFAYNAKDLALLQGIMAGKDENDSTTQKIEIPEYRKELDEKLDPKKLKIGVIKEFLDDQLEEDTRNIIGQKIEVLKNAGFEVKEISMPEVKFGLPVYYILVPAEISSNRARYDGVRYGPKVSENYEENMTKGRSEFFEDEVKRRIMIGTYVLSAGYASQFYKKASKVRTLIKRKFDEIFKEVDVLISPVSSGAAFDIGEKSHDPVSMYLTDLYTVNANIAGIPALAIPGGVDKEKMPIGMQLMGKHFDESTLFRLAKFFEENWE